MQQLLELQDHARALAVRREAELRPAAWESLRRAIGPDGLLQERANAWFLLGSAFFRAGAFADAASYFRRWHETAEEQQRWHESRGDTESARYVMEEIARHSWSFGGMDLFERYVREGCEPRDGLAPRLDVLTALFLAWAVLERQYHPAHWLACRDAAADEERRRIAVQFRGNDAARAVATGILVDARLARAAWWLGRPDEALARTSVAREAFADLARVRPPGLVVHEKRTWRRRLEGLEHLLRADEGPHRLTQAAAAFERALAAAAALHGQDWKDVVLLHLTALAETRAPHPLLESFAASFPHLRHLISRERRWRTE